MVQVKGQMVQVKGQWYRSKVKWYRSKVRCIHVDVYEEQEERITDN